MSDFVLYSYQCNPLHVEIDPKKPSTIPTEFDEEENRRADLNMAKHQELFQEFFDADENNNFKHGGNVYFLHKGSYYGAKILMNQGGIIMLRLQKDKLHEYESDFEILTQKEQPSSMIIIDNRFEQQRIMIERKKDTFAPSTIAKMLENNIGAWFKRKNYRLGIRVPLIYRKDQFWSVVEEFRNGIKKLIFDFPYPNMARPMDKLGASLKKFGVDLKGKVRVVTSSQPRDFLIIDPKEKNEDLDEIVSYLFEVGSPVDVYLVSGRKVKCFSKDNPILVSVSDKMAEFRGKKDATFFPEGFFEGVAEMLNGLKGINYTQETGS